MQLAYDPMIWFLLIHSGGYDNMPQPLVYHLS
jgi:hypothetical protein